MNEHGHRARIQSQPLGDVRVVDLGNVAHLDEVVAAPHRAELTFPPLLGVGAHRAGASLQHSTSFYSFVVAAGAVALRNRPTGAQLQNWAELPNGTADVLLSRC